MRRMPSAARFAPPVQWLQGLDRSVTKRAVGRPGFTLQEGLDPVRAQRPVDAMAGPTISAAETSATPRTPWTINSAVA